jgi:DNA topoisomerase-1
MYNLVIVESPAKAKTIEGYLGSEYKVISSVGHILDLATTGPYGLGIDVENDFAPTYKFMRGKKKVFNDIQKLAKKADKIYIATDPDREGEAIGWHLATELGLDINDMNRIVFVEITKNAVLQGIEDVRSLDMDLVKSQETRRMIDRIMGFRLSKLLQKKIKAKSAGRVQSVALRMIVEREQEIRAFIPDEYWKLFAKTDLLDLDYVGNDKKSSSEIIHDLYNKSLGNNKLVVEDVKLRQKKVKPKTVYTTSTFQQDAVNKLGFTSRRAMSNAQRLYEGVSVNGEVEGLITYMRTDSNRLSPDFVKKCMGYIKTAYGENYIGSYFSKKPKDGVQDAHEGIRPTNLNKTPAFMKQYLTNDEYKVYRLIWNRTIAALMANAELETCTYLFKNESNVEFKTSSTVVLFDGYRVLYMEEDEVTLDKSYKVGDFVDVVDYFKTQHFTQPKPRFTEARLIKELEENGVGRPSTYASIIDTISERGYVNLIDKKFEPTETGELVIEKLKEFFEGIVNVSYTSEMEKKLDLIAMGQEYNIVLLNSFYDEFMQMIENADEKMEKIEAQKTGEICPECGHDLVIRKGRFGDFVACSNYPACKYVVIDEAKSHGECPLCHEGTIIEKNTKRGKVFYSCNKYPACNLAIWELSELDNFDPDAYRAKKEEEAQRKKETAKKRKTKKVKK